MADQDRTFTTDDVSANRGRQQGLGVGERELEAQHDPTVDVDQLEEDLIEDHGSPKISQGAKTRAHTKDIISRRS
ncbi:hypothetical protein [Phenylobacterium sp. J367]|uniref:hypothetical protein n=1 Tax=Phenylobacterium sp. J367 TaxID=2898435 RepID=UPI0021509EBF|nr:hypothetical protein [Phenylobacterium sp. J367]MCR5878356.1 hypothetical protein [Phenylobacterium sp. J367]